MPIEISFSNQPRYLSTDDGDFMLALVAMAAKARERLSAVVDLSGFNLMEEEGYKQSVEAIRRYADSMERAGERIMFFPERAWMRKFPVFAGSSDDGNPVYFDFDVINHDYGPLEEDFDQWKGGGADEFGVRFYRWLYENIDRTDPVFAATAVTLLVQVCSHRYFSDAFKFVTNGLVSERNHARLTKLVREAQGYGRKVFGINISLLDPDPSTADVTKVFKDLRDYMISHGMSSDKRTNRRSSRDYTNAMFDYVSVNRSRGKGWKDLLEGFEERYPDYSGIYSTPRSLSESYRKQRNKRNSI
jgi:hypothetical protein